MQGDPGRRAEVVELMRAGQRAFVRDLTELDDSVEFSVRDWERPGGGGGHARVLDGGEVFERAGVNVSAMNGDRLPASLATRRGLDPETGFFATGLSVVVHPRNPFVPSFHGNFRYFETGADTWWFGGGMDLSPSYGFTQDAMEFHRTLRTYCDDFDLDLYPAAKKTCDDYFQLAHRAEMRGIGGIFFDELRPDGPDGWRRGLSFVRAGIGTLAAAYLPIVRRRMMLPYGDRQREWQLHRRGRYVEFNLLYDRGTKFGLQAGGNTEAILMSLPPTAGWSFDFQPAVGSAEADATTFYQVRDWAAGH
ncbi:oxygen-dependent coproporphyrinogen oxidase [Fodinicola feengrottensis]|uniref:coproporphyrinogen oxidase n=1 Tax=Fodinicola feengrottensis TaxID=435914 RepID=A0ABN2FZR7_9ACTN